MLQYDYYHRLHYKKVLPERREPASIQEVRSVLARQPATIESIRDNFSDLLYRHKDNQEIIVTFAGIVFAKAICSNVTRTIFYAQLCKAITDELDYVGASCGSKAFTKHLTILGDEQFQANFMAGLPAWLDMPARPPSGVLPDDELNDTLDKLLDKRRALGSVKFIRELSKCGVIPETELLKKIESLTEGINDTSNHKLQALSLLASQPQPEAHIGDEARPQRRAFVDASTAQSHTPGGLVPDSTEDKISLATTFPRKSLAAVRVIADIASIQYPEGVNGPLPELNENATEGKFKYDRTFLLQFKAICTGKPVTLTPLDAIGLEPFDQRRHHSDNKVTQNMTIYEPLRPTANRWDRKAIAANPDPVEMACRKTLGLLNRLSETNYALTAFEITAWINKSKEENVDQTISKVVRVIFDKALEKEIWVHLYAWLFQQIMGSLRVSAKGPVNYELTDGRIIFHKYLLQLCLDRLSAPVRTVVHDGAEKTDNDHAVSEKFYAVQEARRQLRCFVELLGKLVEHRMLGESYTRFIMKLLKSKVENPTEAGLKMLCKLLPTTGYILDASSNRAILDVYFSRIQELTKSPDLSPRTRFMLMNLTELRERGWRARAKPRRSTDAGRY